MLSLIWPSQYNISEVKKEWVQIKYGTTDKDEISKAIENG